MPQQQGISFLEREREGVREKERIGRAVQQAGLFKVRFGRDREIENHRNK